MGDVGDYYDRKEIERAAVVRAFHRVRVLAGVSPTPDRILAMMCKVENDMADTGD